MLPDISQQPIGSEKCFSVLPPECKLCKNRHFPNQAHVFGKPKRLKLSVASKEARRKRAWRDKNRERYNAYMRDYMRTYRE